VLFIQRLDGLGNPIDTVLWEEDYTAYSNGNVKSATMAGNSTGTDIYRLKIINRKAQFIQGFGLKFGVWVHTTEVTLECDDCSGEECAEGYRFGFNG
jgi:hypothetical protein